MNQRSQYRVPAPLDDVYVWVLTDTSTIAARPLDLSAGGAALNVPDSCLGDLMVGRKLALRFGIPNSNANFEVESVVRHMSLRNGSRSLGVQFLQSDALQQHLGVFEFFNRRMSQRVMPEEEIPVRIRRTSEFLQLQMRILDISTGGLAGVCRDPDCDLLEVGDSVAAEFTLASIGRRFQLKCIVRSMIPRECAWQTGFSFVEESIECHHQREDITDYVLQQQHKQLKPDPSPELAIGHR